MVTILKRLCKTVRTVFDICLSKRPGTPFVPEALWLGVRLRASMEMEDKSLSMMRKVWAFGSGGPSVAHGKGAELSISRSREKAAVSRRPRRADIELVGFRGNEVCSMDM